jgi:DNA adenine methylase
VVKPLLKWAGGKRHIAPALEKFLPSDWNAGTYFEPFLGGAAFFLHLAPGKAHISDVNQWLIQFYKDVQKNPQALINEIARYTTTYDSLKEEVKKPYYLELREEFNKTEASLKSSALFYVLNKLCFNGLYRENSKGFFNVPFGQKDKFPVLPELEFFEVSEGLQSATIELADFETSSKKAQPGDFIYFDPPYVPLTPTASFTSYSSEGFGLEAQVRLAETLRDLEARGVRAMLSNSAAPLTSEIYQGFRKALITAPRMVSAKSSGRGYIDELVIMNY